MDGRNAFPSSVPSAGATGVSSSWELINYDWSLKGTGRSYSSLLGGSSATVEVFPASKEVGDAHTYFTFVTGPNQPGWHVVKVRIRRQRRIVDFSKEPMLDLSWEQVPGGARLWFKHRSSTWREALVAEATRVGRGSPFYDRSYSLPRPTFNGEKLRIGERV